jgi:hypothetical protein
MTVRGRMPPAVFDEEGGRADLGPWAALHLPSRHGDWPPPHRLAEAFVTDGLYQSPCVKVPVFPGCHAA